MEVGNGGLQQEAGGGQLPLPTLMKFRICLLLFYIMFMPPPYHRVAATGLSEGLE